MEGDGLFRRGRESGKKGIPGTNPRGKDFVERVNKELPGSA